MSKLFISANHLYDDSFLLAKNIYDSGFRPDFIIALWRGGAPIALPIHEFFLYKGIKTYHNCIKIESYSGIDKREETKLEDISWLLKKITPESKVLIVDDIFDSGRTVVEILSHIEPMSSEVKIATLYYKPLSNITGIDPDYYLHITDEWIVFPHELAGLSLSEIEDENLLVYNMIRNYIETNDFKNINMTIIYCGIITISLFIAGFLMILYYLYFKGF